MREFHACLLALSVPLTTVAAGTSASVMLLLSTAKDSTEWRDYAGVAVLIGLPLLVGSFIACACAPDSCRKKCVLFSKIAVVLLTICAFEFLWVMA